MAFVPVFICCKCTNNNGIKQVSVNFFLCFSFCWNKRQQTACNLKASALIVAISRRLKDPRSVCKKYSCSKNCERTAANKDPWDRWDPCAKKYSCHSRYSCSKKFMVTSVFKNLVFKTSCESIEIHHWSIPHCGQPQQFNIQHSKVKIALRASVC